MPIKLTIVASVILLVNLPCGYWRQGVARFSLPWFLAIHIPIPIVIGLRWVTGLGFHWSTYPIIILAYMTGQHLGARWRRYRQGPSA